jgi:hypothetical protein
VPVAKGTYTTGTSDADDWFDLELSLEDLRRAARADGIIMTDAQMRDSLVSWWSTWPLLLLKRGFTRKQYHTGVNLRRKRARKMAR